MTKKLSKTQEKSTKLEDELTKRLQKSYNQAIERCELDASLKIKSKTKYKLIL